MSLYTKEEAKKIVEKVVQFSKADGCEVNLNGGISGNIRYARNSVSTAGENNDSTIVVQSYFGKKAGTATVNEFDDASLEKAVRRSEELATLAPENPEFMEPLAQQHMGNRKLTLKRRQRSHRIFGRSQLPIVLNWPAIMALRPLVFLKTGTAPPR